MSEVAFGIHAVNSLLRRSPDRILSLSIQVDRNDKRIQELVSLAQNQGIALARVPKAELDELTTERHQGVVAVIERIGTTALLSERDLPSFLGAIACPLVLVLDGVTDPHNLGACLRSADAAGVHAVVVPKDNSAELNATARKVASGAADVVPLVSVTNLARTLKALKDAGLWVIGTTGDADVLVYEQDLALPAAIVMGAEGAGMRRLTTEACDFLVKLPMLGAVSSLNVSVATGIILFEAVRQRGA
ncbi:MAG: 23S rRNA (guanosine(2251)-2'-O)-methyltransferase RlmB [Luminiphilus sp.]|jgi:23S rRNA (guanosine2251-2'-O)-methyltransferase|nr:23S rRNA (guanosine(2251)-2'-O)-methyltransferase RlmB [Pseudomonadales bacterium]MBL6823362.1 23S rRNA (guanosine(2251)-2'-O)-methyltransferase RlmB [Luminiphilus sp.]MBL6900945.1 23S rRNA (guanosine(2251)-2'-O)-methyltransferase RlmB [Luminiphilus sp.]